MRGGRLGQKDPAYFVVAPQGLWSTPTIGILSGETSSVEITGKREEDEVGAVIDFDLPRPWLSPVEVVVTFRDLLESVEGVEGILSDRSGDGFSLSVIVNNPSEEQRREIYDREWGLMQHYLGTGIDFHLVDRQNRPLRDVAAIELFDVYIRI